MKKLLLAFYASFLGICMYVQGSSDGLYFEVMEIYGHNSIIPYDDSNGFTYAYAYESRCTENDSTVDRYGTAALVTIINCTKGKLIADRTQGKKALMISDEINPQRLANGAIYWSAIYKGGPQKYENAHTFLYSHYFWLNDPSVKDTGRPVYFTIRCWNKRSIPFDPKSGQTGLKKASGIISYVAMANSFTPYVKYAFKSLDILFKLIINHGENPNPNDFVYRLNGYMVTANPANSNCVPGWSTLYGIDGKESYDSYAMQVAGDKERDSAANYVVQNSCIRSAKIKDGRYTIPIYIMTIYYEKDYYSAKLKTYCKDILERGWSKDNEQLSTLVKKLSDSEFSKLSDRFGEMKHEDLMKVNDAIESVFKSHNDHVTPDQAAQNAKYKDALRVLGNI